MNRSIYCSGYCPANKSKVEAAGDDKDRAAFTVTSAELFASWHVEGLKPKSTNVETLLSHTSTA